MTVVLCLQTCDRPALTATTLATFAQHNDLTRFVLVHGDDASETSENCDLADAYGFQTVVRSSQRVGMRAMRTALFARAAVVADWICFVENDIESVRPFPWRLFEFVRRIPSVYCLRLYGRFKDRQRREPCLTTHKRLEHQPVTWRPLRDAPEKAQIGLIHWSAQPAVTRADELMDLHLTGREPMGLTARVKKNVTFHVGVDRTPGRLK